MINEFNIGDKVWVKLSWVDDDCWEQAEIVKVTDKRIKVQGLGRGDGYYKPEHIERVA